MKTMMSHRHGMDMNADDFVAAQAIKDATMGYSIAQVMKNNKGSQMIHFNGNFHSKNHEGIVWYLSQYAPKLKLAVISFIEQESIGILNEENKSNNEFTIVCPSNMTKTNR